MHAMRCCGAQCLPPCHAARLPATVTIFPLIIAWLAERITLNNMKKYEQTELRGATMFSNQMLQGG